MWRNFADVNNPPFVGGSGMAFRDSGPTGRDDCAPNTEGPVSPPTAETESRQLRRSRPFFSSSEGHIDDAVNRLTRATLSASADKEDTFCGVFPTSPRRKYEEDVSLRGGQIASIATGESAAATTSGVYGSDDIKRGRRQELGTVSSVQDRNTVSAAIAAVPLGYFEVPVVNTTPTVEAGSGRGWFWGTPT